MTEVTADVFGELRRFHVYDHDEGEWLMSGCDFGDIGIAIDHKYNRNIETYDNPEIIAKGQDNLQFVWEDEYNDSSLDRIVLDTEVADEIIKAALADVARQINTPRDRVMISSIISPGEVEYLKL